MIDPIVPFGEATSTEPSGVPDFHLSLKSKYGRREARVRVIRSDAEAR